MGFGAAGDPSAAVQVHDDGEGAAALGHGDIGAHAGPQFDILMEGADLGEVLIHHRREHLHRASKPRNIAWDGRGSEGLEEFAFAVGQHELLLLGWMAGSVSSNRKRISTQTDRSDQNPAATIGAERPALPLSLPERKVSARQVAIQLRRIEVEAAGFRRSPRRSRILVWSRQWQSAYDYSNLIKSRGGSQATTGNQILRLIWSASGSTLDGEFNMESKRRPKHLSSATYPLWRDSSFA